MKPKIKRFLFILITIFSIWGVGFAAYNYSDTVKNIFSKWYSSSYSLEEVNEKIFALQQKSVAKIKEEYMNSLSKSKKQRVQWNMTIDTQVSSSFWGWNASVVLDNIDMQYDSAKLDILLEWLSMSGSAQILWETKQAQLWMKKGHLITNSSGSYVQVKDMDIVSFWEEILPREIIMTLNKIWQSDKYVDLSENFLYSILESQMKERSSDANIMQNTIIKFWENEPILSAYKQEETRYYLAPSTSICKLIKNEKIEKQENTVESNSQIDDIFSSYQKPSPMTYEEFKSEYAECSSEEYQRLIDAFLKSENHEIKNFYIELNATKVHYVTDMLLSLPESGKPRYMNVKAGFEGTASLTESEASKLYITLLSDSITWSWVLLEQNWSDINGYVDIDMPEYNLDTNIIISGTADNLSVNWDYSYTAPEKISSWGIKPLEWLLTWIDISGTMTGSFTNENYSFNATNTVIGEGLGYSGEMILDINGSAVQDSNIWEMTLKWKLKMGENASPMTWEVQMLWNTETSDSLARWDVSYSLDVPNIASGKYDINYDFTISDTLESTFETPENILPQKNLDSLIMLNKRIVEKEKAAEIQKKIKQLEDWNNTFTPREIQIINANTNAHTRMLASSIERNVSSSQNPLDSYISNPKQYATSNSGTLYIWNIDYNKMSLPSEDFLSPLWKDHEIRVLKIDVGWEKRSYYEVSWYRIINNALERQIRWNYISWDLPDVQSLFDIEVK